MESSSADPNAARLALQEAEAAREQLLRRDLLPRWYLVGQFVGVLVLCAGPSLREPWIWPCVSISLILSPVLTYLLRRSSGVRIGPSLWRPETGGMKPSEIELTLGLLLVAAVLEFGLNLRGAFAVMGIPLAVLQHRILCRYDREQREWARKRV